MDINTLRGLSTVIMLVAFIALVLWAYSSRRKRSFDDAAQLPFADEEAHRQTLKAAQANTTVEKNGSLHGSNKGS
jgi:cytochrome c oxidase cbb3-type subunit 4